ncbi:hypothetical protein LTR40_001638 [Exophiala xenobiotica]|nr:hypothetical protein LTR40_001638 [Exophiala xenobiotica]
MCLVEEPSPDRGFATAPRKRRAHSCLPCPQCDGGLPCSTCARKRSKPACVYRDTLEENGQIQGPKEAGLGASISGHADGRQYRITINPTFSGAFSLSSLASYLERKSSYYKQTLVETGILAAEVWKSIADPVCVWDTGEGQEDVQGLTVAARSLGSPFPKLIRGILSLTLRNLYASYLVAQQWFYKAEAVRAWTTLTSVIRRAELIGHQDSSADISEVDAQTLEQRRHMWWLLVHLDTQLSLVLGRRPLIGAHQHVAPPTFRSLPGPERSLARHVFEFTQITLGVLSDLPSGPLGPEGLSRSESEILEGHLSRLQQIRSRCPELPADGKHNPRLSMGIAAHRIEVELVSMVLNCQISLLVASRLPPQHELSQEQIRFSEKKQVDRCASSRSARSFCDDTVNSTSRITAAFDYITQSCAAPSEPSWTRCYAQLSTVAILAVSQIRHELQLHEEKARTEHVLEDLHRLFADQSTHAVTGMTSSPTPPTVRETQPRPNTGSNYNFVSPDSQNKSASSTTAQASDTVAGTFSAPCPSSPVGRSLQKRKHAPSARDQRAMKRSRYMEPPVLVSNEEAEMLGALPATKRETAPREHPSSAEAELGDDQQRLYNQRVAAPPHLPSYLPISGPSSEVNWFEPAETGYFWEELRPEYRRSYSAPEIPMNFHPPVPEVATWQSLHYPNELGIGYQGCGITFP